MNTLLAVAILVSGLFVLPPQEKPLDKPPEKISCPMHEPHKSSQEDQHRSEEHTSELQSQFHLVCRLLLEKKKKSFHSVVARSWNCFPTLTLSRIEGDTRLWRQP